MVAPVVYAGYSSSEGPYSHTDRDRFTQSKPYNVPAPYRVTRVTGVDRLSNSEGFDSGFVKNVSFGRNSFTDYALHHAATYNAAYEKFRGMISDSAGWAENIAQAGKARTMFVNRAVQLAQFATALKHHRFGDAARILRTPTPSRASNKKAVSQNFLEYEYGLKPIISDLHGTMQVLTSDPGLRKIKASRMTIMRDDYSTYILGGFDTQKAVCRLAITLRSGVRVTNPNLFLANQLGLTDLALPWKLIPFSFVVDWFVNVEQVISSVTDDFGLTLVEPHWTWFTRSDLRKFTYTPYESMGIQHSTSSTRNQVAVEMLRSTGIPGPTLIIKPFKGFSVQRGAQAIALVLAVLGK